MIRRDYSDFVLREISMLVRFLSKTVLHREAQEEEIILYDQTAQQKNDDLDTELILLVRQGKLNEAENRLFEALEEECTPENFASAIQFYLTLYEMEEEELAKHDFSREEIAEGFADVRKLFGIEDVLSV
ncbi:MAG TPA: hypothetical protein H9662_07265 [Firmicutes bacterium]|nr:hypothetical protein [Bacillota bacterium]